MLKFYRSNSKAIPLYQEKEEQVEAVHDNLMLKEPQMEELLVGGKWFLMGLAFRKLAFNFT